MHAPGHKSAAPSLTDAQSELLLALAKQQVFAARLASVNGSTVYQIRAKSWQAVLIREAVDTRIATTPEAFAAALEDNAAAVIYVPVAAAIGQAEAKRMLRSARRQTVILWEVDAPLR